jgi:hypothetical protein
MATKKAAADKCPQEIVITGTGPNELFTYVDPTGGKHHPGVFFQALDLATQYQIVLGNPPLPFTNGNGPFLTDATTGRTITLTVDKNLKPGATVYPYTVQVQSRITGKWKKLSAGGGIIIDE